LGKEKEKSCGRSGKNGLLKERNFRRKINES